MLIVSRFFRREPRRGRHWMCDIARREKKLNVYSSATVTACRNTVGRRTALSGKMRAPSKYWIEKLVLAIIYFCTVVSDVLRAECRHRDNFACKINFFFIIPTVCVPFVFTRSKPKVYSIFMFYFFRGRNIWILVECVYFLIFVFLSSLNLVTH